MPLNKIPKYFNSETRHLVDAALEDAWQELNKEGLVEAHQARMKLATTIVALASVGEKDPPAFLMRSEPGEPNRRGFRFLSRGSDGRRDSAAGCPNSIETL